MSLLLDALNKADQERKRNQATPGINSNHEQAIGHDLRNKSIIIIVIGVLGFAILLAAIYWLGQRSAISTTTSTVTPVNTTASVTPAISQTQNSLAKKQSASTATQKPIASSQDDIDTSEENVASLYQQNAPAQNTNATLTISTPTTDTTMNALTNQPAHLPSVESPAAHATQQPLVAPTSITQFANLPDLHDLPSQILEKIPTLNYSEHNFNNVGGNVKINGTLYHVNDQLASGLVIDKILEDGMILHIDNYSFKMRALNSWVNM